MRSRSNSGVKLDNYARVIQKTLLQYQDPVTGLFSAGKNQPHAWVRDNLYSIQAVWALALAYRKHADLDEDKAKSYELEQSVVKCMRSLLQCMMRQVNKLEKFKISQLPHDALHAKYDRKTCASVVGDKEWGHLQLDATGLFLLMLSQMIASGINLIYNLDEVAFIQNLVFYIESAYRTPDYGVWERGDKTNHGVPELNASSVGMCKAALEAIDELDLFGANGGPQSVIHVTPDEKAQCQAILESMLPRESNSKEVDAGLLAIIGYPAFAVNNRELVRITKETIVDKLQGRYGCARFLRDGYKTAREDQNRLHYELAELKVFEDIECEWPLFWAYLILDGLFCGNKEQVNEYREALDEILVTVDGVKCVPELYAVPSDLVDEEKADPHSQKRIPLGKIPHMWGHSLYVMGQLIHDGFLAAGEVDPLNRRFSTDSKPDIVIQVVFLSENKQIQEVLRKDGFETPTINQIEPIKVQPAKILSKIYSRLGKNAKMNLSGRPKNRIGILGTSKLYVIRDNIFVFTPELLDQEDFYMSLDIDMLIDMMTTELQYLVKHWTMPGRPTITVPITINALTNDGTRLNSHMRATIKKIQNGYVNGVRVVTGELRNFLSTSCFSRLTFLESEDFKNDELTKYLDSLTTKSVAKHRAIAPIASTSILLDANMKRRLAEVSDMRRTSTDLTSTLIGSDISHMHSATKYEGERQRTVSYGSPLCDQRNVDIEVLLQHLSSPESSLEEQINILHYLYMAKGPDFDVQPQSSTYVSVKSMAENVYEKAGQEGNWFVVRQATGLLRKRVNGLSQSVTDLLVRQKQITVGLPPEPREKTITRPLPPNKLHDLIMSAFGDDMDVAVLTQEIIMYLAMFIRSSPSLFSDLLRLRIGLIIQVMASELARHLNCSGEEASAQLMSLSPYEMKQLIHNILSGKEFGITKSVQISNKVHGGGSVISINTNQLSSKADKTQFHNIQKRLRSSRQTNQGRNLTTGLSVGSGSQQTSVNSIKTMDDILSHRQELVRQTSITDTNYLQFSGEKRGQWIRRRRIDGALNRVPLNFYTKIWSLLERCYGIMVGNHHIPSYVTKEMTAGELKFALLVENVLNHIPQPEYRQLIVETLVVLTLLTDVPKPDFLPDSIDINKVLKTASDMFLEDQKIAAAPEIMLQIDEGTGISTEFYDCAPSGTFGTMTYLAKALSLIFHSYFPQHVGDCFVS